MSKVSDKFPIKVYTLRVSEAEHALIKEAAHFHAKSANAWMREQLGLEKRMEADPSGTALGQWMGEIPPATNEATQVNHQGTKDPQR
jgi:predicted HicB family RNase H-like nuclease